MKLDEQVCVSGRVATGPSSVLPTPSSMSSCTSTTSWPPWGPRYFYYCTSWPLWDTRYFKYFLASLGPQVLLLLFRLAGTVGPQVLLLLPRIYGTLGKIYTSSLPLWDPRSFYYFLDSPGPQVIYTSSLPLWDLWTIGYRPFISS